MSTFERLPYISGGSIGFEPKIGKRGKRRSHVEYLTVPDQRG